MPTPSMFRCPHGGGERCVYGRCDTACVQAADEAGAFSRAAQRVDDALGRDSATKPTNPKDAIGSDKLPLHLWPTTATALGCLGLLDGALKYGRTNWRDAGVRVSIYVDAAQRHLAAYFEGEDADPDSGLPHLAHALACLAILVDAAAAGRLTDDRAYRGAGYRALVERLTPNVARLKALHAGRSPRHFTIAGMESVG